MTFTGRHICHNSAAAGNAHYSTEQLLQVPTARRIPICLRNCMVEPMLVIIKVSKAMEATNSGLTKPMFDILGLTQMPHN